MTPGARVAAAIDVLDQWIGGVRLEVALTQWARSHRFAGSSDRAAIRDYCYDVARRKRSCAWLGGSETGRGLMIGLLRAHGEQVEPFFTGEGYAPAKLTTAELTTNALDRAPEPVQLDCPDWLWSHFDTYGPRKTELLRIMQTRAPVFLRVNLLRATVAQAMEMLAQDGIVVEPHPLSDTALKVVQNPRRVAQSRAFCGGMVELQDASSQAVVDRLGLSEGDSVLDYCAGGGGKSLAIAARTKTVVHAHDAFPDRVKDIPLRAKRAEANIKVVAKPPTLKRKFDFVVCDAPCSGSGSWRRDPEGKWRLTADALASLNATQVGILDAASQLVRPGGVLAYLTCSVFETENQQVVAKFISGNRSFEIEVDHQFLPFDGGDGFYIARLRKAA